MNISVTQVIANQEIKIELSSSISDKDKLEEVSSDLYLKCLNQLIILAEMVLKK